MRHARQQYLAGEMVLVIDCSDLERSAAFWCDALGCNGNELCVVEPPAEHWRA